MKLAELSTRLRDTSAQYGGIAEFKMAAGALDSAVNLFLSDQDDVSLRGLVAQHAHCVRLVDLHKQRVAAV